jgi:TrmH family RNA methyltransferase
MGAHFRLPLAKMDWEEIKDYTRNLTVYLAEMAGDVVYTEASLKRACALLLGGEANGASQSARDLAEQTISIPMPGKMESLNAAVAGAVLLFEAVRQREGWSAET